MMAVLAVAGASISIQRMKKLKQLPNNSSVHVNKKPVKTLQALLDLPD
jgi:hypothetical protein